MHKPQALALPAGILYALCILFFEGEKKKNKAIFFEGRVIKMLVRDHWKLNIKASDCRLGHLSLGILISGA